MDYIEIKRFDEKFVSVEFKGDEEVLCSMIFSAMNNNEQFASYILAAATHYLKSKSIFNSDLISKN